MDHGGYIFNLSWQFVGDAYATIEDKQALDKVSRRESHPPVAIKSHSQFDAPVNGSPARAASHLAIMLATACGLPHASLEGVTTPGFWMSCHASRLRWYQALASLQSWSCCWCVRWVSEARR